VGYPARVSSVDWSASVGFSPCEKIDIGVVEKVSDKNKFTVRAISE